MPAPPLPEVRVAPPPRLAMTAPFTTAGRTVANGSHLMKRVALAGGIVLIVTSTLAAQVPPSFAAPKDLKDGFDAKILDAAPPAKPIVPLPANSASPALPCRVTAIPDSAASAALTAP